MPPHILSYILEGQTILFLTTSSLNTTTLIHFTSAKTMEQSYLMEKRGESSQGKFALGDGAAWEYGNANLFNQFLGWLIILPACTKPQVYACLTFN